MSGLRASHLFAVLALSAASAPTLGQATERALTPVTMGGELTLATPAAPPSWNPLTAAGDITTNRQQQWPLYPHPFLTGTDASVLPNPDLLVSAKIVADSPMVVEYVIRDQAVWSDGVPITIDDFRYTWRAQDPRTCKDCLAAFTQGYDTISDMSPGATNKTVRVTFSKPFAPWKTLFPYILPAHVATTYGDLPTSFNVGLSKTVPKVSGGPYMVDDYQNGVVLTLRKNPKWYGTPAHLDVVRFRYIAQIGEQVTALQNGEIDALYGGATLDTLDQVKQLSDVTVEVGPTLTYYHFSLKAAGDPMGSAPLREAIAKALSIRDMTAQTVGQYVKNAAPMTSAAYIPDQVVGVVKATRDNTAATGVGTGDTKGALEILQKAGFSLAGGKLTAANGKAVPPIRILTYSVDPLRVQLAELAQAQLARIWLTVVISAADASRYNSEAKAGNFDLYATGTALDLGALSLAQWYQTGASRNYFGYSSKVVDDLVDKISVTLDDAETVSLTNDLDAALLKDGMVVPLYPIINMAVYSSKFANIFVNPSKYGTTMNVQDWGLRAPQ